MKLKDADDAESEAFDPFQPLFPKWRERFVCAYARLYDGEEAARDAGYGHRAGRVGWRLLERPDVRARLSVIARRLDQTPRTKEGLLEHLHHMTSEDFSNLYVEDPSTGGVTLDLGRATPSQLSRLEFKQTTVEENGNMKQTTVITKPDELSRLKPLLIHYGIFRPRPEADVNQELLQAARAISAASPPITPEYAKQNAHRLSGNAEDH